MAAKITREAFSSSSSSYRRPKWTYDVFLSFRREDTRKKFTDHLYLALVNAGIHTFRDDDELRRGEEISSELLKAIEGSRISVIVFSRNYATSRWCLEELVKIMECRRTGMQLVVPIFYDVDPTDIRYQKGSFEEAFKKHEERFLLDEDKVFRWRRALTEAANLSGWDLRNTADGHEGKFIKKVVEAISRELNITYLFVALYPVGIDSRVQDMISLLSVGGDVVRMVGIWGMGGMGKTTLAKAIYNEFYHRFEGKSFLANVRETSKQPNGQVRLQEQLLSNILKTSKVKVSSVDRGINMIKERLCGRRVLVIVDDVDELDQLNAIARRRDWFGLGSRIIITTRDEHLLKALEVDDVYTTKEMNSNESLELFSWHAFRNSSPTEDYTDLSRIIVAYSGGLPLALEVLGSFLFSRTILEWESALAKLKMIPHDQIQKKLKISFDALSDETEKDIFLDISCFFIGMEKNYVVQILDGCGFFVEIGISVLIQRCLLTVGERNKLSMHDLLRDMGREIVREKSSNELGKYSRLWLHEDALDILTKHKGTNAVEGLTLKLPRFSKMSFSAKAFIEMQRLRLLRLDHAQLTGDYEYLSKELRWLRWHGFPLKFIPNNFYPRNLVAMDLRYSNLRHVWKDPKLLEKLKILKLSHSHYLTQTPDFSRVPKLERLILKDCKRLFEVHQSIGDLCKLVLVNLKDCTNLKSLPRSFYKLKSLETLILSGCTKFDNLANDLGEMESLITFLLDNTAIRQVPHTIVRLKNLKYLSLSGCGGSTLTSKTLPSLFWSLILPRKSPKSINLLPTSLQGLKSLRELSLKGCNLIDDALPKDLGSLCSLRSLDLESNSFHSLPSSLGDLLKLQSLTLNYCTNLRSIPNLPASLSHLHARNCMTLERMPNLSMISNIGDLVLTNCHKLVVIPGLDKLLKSNPIIPGSDDLFLSKSIPVCMEGCNSITNTFKQRILQGWTMSGVDIFIPGNEIPDWFTYKDDGSSVCFEVPHHHQKLEGFTVRSVYSSCIDKTITEHCCRVFVFSYTMDLLNATEQVIDDAVISPEDHLWQVNISLNETLEGGDKITVIVDFGPRIIVKKTGVYLIYDRVVHARMIENTSTSNEIPDWFTYKDEGSSIRFEVPPIIDQNLEGFTVCIVYSSCPNKMISEDLLSISVINYTKNIRITYYKPVTIDVVISFEDHLRQGSVFTSECNLEGGDEVEVVVDFLSEIIVKETGVYLIYDNEDQMIEYISTLKEDAIFVNDNEDACTDHHVGGAYHLQYKRLQFLKCDKVAQ